MRFDIELLRLKKIVLHQDQIARRGHAERRSLA